MRTALGLLVLLGLTGSLTAQITVNDYEMKLRADINVLESVAPVTASSTCGAVTTDVEDLKFSGGCLGTLARTYTFTDACGFVVTAQQFITLEDSTPPVFDNLPANLSASAKSIPDAPEVTATDDSGEKVKVVYNEFRQGATLTRTWVAEDQCGNSAVGQQVISLTDL